MVPACREEEEEEEVEVEVEEEEASASAATEGRGEAPSSCCLLGACHCDLSVRVLNQ